MTITTVGIDFAKNVFAVHGVDQNGKAVLIKSRVTRTALPGLIAERTTAGLESARARGRKAVVRSR